MCVAPRFRTDHVSGFSICISACRDRRGMHWEASVVTRILRQFVARCHLLPKSATPRRCIAEIVNMTMRHTYTVDYMKLWIDTLVGPGVFWFRVERSRPSVGPFQVSKVRAGRKLPSCPVSVPETSDLRCRGRRGGTSFIHTLSPRVHGADNASTLSPLVALRTELFYSHALHGD